MCSYQALDRIRGDIGEAYVWIAVDETTDACGRFTANVIVGKLDKDSPSEGHLIASKQLEATNHATIVRVLQDSFRETIQSI